MTTRAIDKRAQNGGSNGMTANTSSPDVSNAGSTAANSAANAASNGLGYGDVSGLASLSPSAGQLASVTGSTACSGPLN